MVPGIDDDREWRLMTNPSILRCADAAHYACLSRTIDSEAISDEGIVEQILRLPDLAAEVLKTANSDDWARSMTIDRLDRAVILLGREGLKIAVNAVGDRFGLEGRRHGSILEHYVHHSRIICEAAELIATAAELPLVAEAKTAGLLHDFGALLHLSQSPEKFAEAIAASRASGVRLVEHEKLLLGADHCEIGERWAKDNGLPPSVTAAISWHHDPMSAPIEHRYLTMIVYAAECLARHAGFGDLDGDPKPVLEERVLCELRLSPKVIGACAPALREKVAAIENPYATPVAQRAS